MQLKEYFKQRQKHKSLLKAIPIFLCLVQLSSQTTQILAISTPPPHQKKKTVKKDDLTVMHQSIGKTHDWLSWFDYQWLSNNSNIIIVNGCVRRTKNALQS